MSTQRDKAARLARVLGEIRGGELAVGGVPLNELAAKGGRSFYVYNGDVIEQRVRRVQQAVGPETQLFFSLKANPSLGVCQLMARLGVGAELASIGELHLARRAEFSAGHVIFAGPGKTDEELEDAVQFGIESINVESRGELERLSEIARAAGKPARVCLRINPKEQVRGAQMRMGGGSLQFGIDEEQVSPLLREFADSPHVRIVGLHVYVGSQIFDIAALETHCKEVVRMADAMSGQLGRPIEVIDFGGGFAVPYFENSPDFDLEAFSVAYRRVVEQAKASASTASARLVIELGRYLVAEAGLYVTRVTDVKESRGTKYLVTDGGMNHHITATGNFGQVFRKPYPIAILNRMDAACDVQSSIVGPCCTPLDVLGQKVELPDAKTGDYVGVFYSGAYGYSASSLSFLSHPTPAELFIYRGRAQLLRASGRPDAVLTGQIPADLSSA